MSEGLDRITQKIEEMRRRLRSQRSSLEGTVDASRVRPLQVLRDSPFRPLRNRAEERPLGGSILDRLKRRRQP